MPSPNIWDSPATYEVENLALDRAGLIDEALREVADWAGLDVLDVGCGTGFHLPRLAATARTVTGVEPHPPLLRLARRRTARLPSVSVLAGTAAAVPLPPASVDLVHARWAYFFGPGCEPGLTELDRLVRRGGAACVVDVDASTSTFGRWFRAAYPTVDPATVLRFWSSHGWTRVAMVVDLQCDSRADLEAVVRIELDPRTADAALAKHDGTTVDYAVNLFFRRF